MTKSFSLTKLLNDQSTAVAQDNQSGHTDFKIVHIPYDQLHPSKDNFYSMSDIEQLADTIALCGLQQNLVVKQSQDRGYTITAGHRRHKALGLLIERGYEEYTRIPCKVEQPDNLSRIRMLVTNATARELTDYDKTQQAQELKKELLLLKQQGVKIKGKLRDIIADTLGVSSTQVARMESINNNLLPAFKEEFKSQHINASTAYELSGLSEPEQKKLYQDHKKTGSTTINDAKRAKAQPPIQPGEPEEPPLEGQLLFDGATPELIEVNTTEPEQPELQKQNPKVQDTKSESPKREQTKTTEYRYYVSIEVPVGALKKEIDRIHIDLDASICEIMGEDCEIIESVLDKA